MYLERASAKIHNFELYIIELKNYKKNLQDFMFLQKLSKTQGKKIMSEILSIDKKIERKSNVFANSMRLEHKKIK